MSPTTSEPASEPGRGHGDGDGNSGQVGSGDTMNDSGASGSEEKTQEDAPNKKPSALARLKTLWAKVGLDTATMKVMAKGALAPTIALSAYVKVMPHKKTQGRF